MHSTFRVAHKPLISFIGKRQWPSGECRVPASVLVLSMLSGPQPQRPHPAAPAQLKEAFSDFLEKYKNFSSLPGISKNHSQQNSRGLRFNEFWEAPEHLWRPKINQLEDSEIDAVLVSLALPVDGILNSLSVFL